MRRALAAEVVKLRTTRMWWGLLLGLVVLVAVQVAFSAAFAGRDLGAGAPALPALDTAAGLRTALSSGYQYGYLMALVLGTIVGAVDFRHRTATQTFLAAPRRGDVVVAKNVACAGAGALYAVVTQGLALGVVVLVAAVRGIGIDLGGDGVVRSVLLGLVGIVLWCVVGVGLGVLLRNQVAAVLVAVGYVLLIDPLAALALRQLGASPVDQYTLGSAASALVSPDTGTDLLRWWAGGLVVLGYVVVITAAGWWVTVRRDVT